MRWMLVLPAVLAACGEMAGANEAAIRVQRVQVEGLATNEDEWVRKAAERALAASSRFRMDPDGDGVVALSYRDVHATTGSALRLDLVIQDPTASTPPQLAATVVLERRSVDLARDLPVAIERAVAVLEAKAGLGARDLEVAQALLEGPDPELSKLALEWIAREQRTDLRAAVRSELEDEDIEVAKAAIDCLAAIGTDADAEALVAATRLADRDHTERLYAALGILGGDAAEGFLAFAAENEDDAELAEQARSALERARARGEANERSRPRIARGHR